ncbi:MAG: hypothetical protein ACJ8OJ_22755 [Povalibacter sp.]
MAGNDTQINPGKAGPKGALEEKPAGQDAPSSGPSGNEGNNTRRDFVKLAKHRKDSDDDDAPPSGARNESHR